MPSAIASALSRNTKNLFRALQSISRSMKEDESAMGRGGDAATDGSVSVIAYPIVESATFPAGRSFERFGRRSFRKRRQSNENPPERCNQADVPFRDGLAF